MIGVEELEKRHLETYKEALLELICNNTNTLINEDVLSLLKQPPLDSMDYVRNKLVTLSKKNGVILDTQIVNQLLQDYRTLLVQSFSDIGNRRLFHLSKIVRDFVPKKQSDIIKIPKKEFLVINRKLKKDAKEKIKNCNQLLLKELPNLFKDNTAVSDREMVIIAMGKYLTGSYSRDLIEGIELKILIKDTTLMNSILEQGERYLFTRNHSHLFDNNDSK